jgi:hypothetical protein
VIFDGVPVEARLVLLIAADLDDIAAVLRQLVREESIDSVDDIVSQHDYFMIKNYNTLTNPLISLS